jgi:hypothetical protein
MKSYFVSLTGDLLGVYIEYQAESQLAVRQYLEKTYLRDHTWKLPWCAVYERIPNDPGTVIVPAKCGQIWEREL